MTKVTSVRVLVAMKKIIGVLLTVCLLIAGCNAGSVPPIEPTSSSQSGGDSIRPTIVEMLDFDTPMLMVTVCINPEFTLTLNFAYDILSAEALNADAETLLANLDILGKPYVDGIVSILEEAREQGFLKNAGKVTLDVEELSAGGWTIASRDMLSEPVEDYQQSSGVVFSCKLNPAGEVLDPNQLTKVDIGPTAAEYRDGTGMCRIRIITWSDGSVTTDYPLDGFRDRNKIVITEFPDGRYSYEVWDNGVAKGYTQFPDGSRSAFVAEYQDNYDYSKQTNDRRFIWRKETYSNGMIEETLYDENGEVEDTIIIYPERYTETIQNEDGSTTVIVYNISGVTETNTTWPNGDYENWVHNEKGIPVRLVCQKGDRYDEVSFHENGNVKTSEFRGPNDDYGKATYDENGKSITSISYSEGVYQELTFDADGNMIDLYMRNAEGDEFVLKDGEVVPKDEE